MGRVVHFEIPVEDFARAGKFYESVFGWKVYKWDGPVEYWLVETGPDGETGINGGLTPRSPGVPSNAPVNTMSVDNVDATIASIEAAGGAVVQPKMAIPGVGYLAYCTDTEGVLFGVMQSNKNAG